MIEVECYYDYMSQSTNSKFWTSLEFNISFFFKCDPFPFMFINIYKYIFKNLFCVPTLDFGSLSQNLRLPYLSIYFRRLKEPSGTCLPVRGYLFLIVLEQQDSRILGSLHCLYFYLDLYFAFCAKVLLSRSWIAAPVFLSAIALSASFDGSAACPLCSPLCPLCTSALPTLCCAFIWALCAVHNVRTNHCAHCTREPAPIVLHYVCMIH